MTAPTLTDYERALAAEPELRTAVTVVDALIALRRPDDRLCSGCVWELILKPMVEPLIGWERGVPPEQAREVRMTVGEALDLILADEVPAAPPAESETEAWLRTHEAWDAFTNALLARLDDADPGNGHGIGRCAS